MHYAGVTTGDLFGKCGGVSGLVMPFRSALVSIDAGAES